jgi:glutamate-ammonia-ligase adenylyltransferase
MAETSASLYSATQLACLLQDVVSAGVETRFIADLALALRQADPSQMSAATVRCLAQALLTSVDPPRAMNHWLRYLDNVPNHHAFWYTVSCAVEAFADILRLFASSQLLSSILWRRPSLLDWLLHGALVGPSPTPRALDSELAQSLTSVTDDNEAGAIIRAFTQQHLLRIGARDLGGWADVETTTADLSALADCVLQAGLHVCTRWLTALYGAPTYSDADGVVQPCGFCVIGMGKLGGYELNFSSDIDLMYVYTSYEGSTSGITLDGQPVASISNHEYFVTLARRLTTLIGGQGPDGQAFRVDLRLRPEGTQGQLALSLPSYEAYYARLAQPWERMALIKARTVAGDRDLGETFLAMVRPFVYQRYLDDEGVRQIRDMKHQIDVQLADRAQSRTHVKLGLGGIREIEFLIQLPQLLYGGRQPALQDPHSLHALPKLHQAGLLTTDVETTLRETYCYLRRLEHYLQMEQGAQTHMLPRQAAQQARVARYFGHPTWEAFYQDYLERTATVHAIFVAAFQEGEEEPV